MKIMAECIFQPGLGCWDIATSSWKKAKKYKIGKPETQGEWKLSPHQEISENHSERYPML